MGSDRISVDRAEIKIRGSSLSRRESSLVPSHGGSAVDALEFSPGLPKSSQVVGEDYAFDGTPPCSALAMAIHDEHIVDNLPNNSAFDSQRSDMNLITLERNSYNFLECVDAHCASDF